MGEEPGLLVIREVKAFRGRDDTLFGLPFFPAVIFMGITALLVLYYEWWTAAAVWFFGISIIGKVLANKDPYWLENLPRFVRLPRWLSP
jgi:hypothetical protein